MPTIRVPKTLNFGAHELDVVFCPTLVMDRGNVGEICRRRGRITLQTGTPASNNLVTYLHEFVHLVDQSYHIGLDDTGNDRVAEGIAALLVNTFGLNFDWRDIPHADNA